ncbi:MAG TPA: efflux RND transporter periplasmic adaptor subunit [Thermoanaerobaculia bacterium]|jgi:multidrug efflux pump subunit AcrA (membrane-fusion protein)|nr:efflux RND transporter periplasmic adaptor subunit [Thermoanaerobaculia bacterium]
MKTRTFVSFFIIAILAFACRQQKTINGVVQDNSGRRVLYWADPMIAQGPPHNYTSDKPGIAPDCGMRLVPVYADTAEGGGAPQSGVAISPQRQQLIGVKLAKAEVRDLSRMTRTVGTVASDERRRATIQTKFDGYVEALYASVTGQSVRRGQPLASIYSPDLLATQNELLLAAKNKTQFGAELYEAARRRLLLWDMTAADIDRVVRSGKPTRAVTLRSPVDGVVITKNVVLGNRVMAGQTLYEIADLRVVWVQADVYESELPYIRVGQPAQVTLSYYPGRSWSGRVAFITPTVDPNTRTAKVRIELANADGALRPDMFADVILQEPIGAVVAVPDEAVLQTGTRSVVFVARGNGAFEPREVRTGAHVEGFWEIRSGVQAGESVVAQANFLVDSESRLKSAMEQMKP